MKQRSKFQKVGTVAFSFRYTTQQLSGVSDHTDGNLCCRSLITIYLQLAASLAFIPQNSLTTKEI